MNRLENRENAEAENVITLLPAEFRANIDTLWGLITEYAMACWLSDNMQECYDIKFDRFCFSGATDWKMRGEWAEDSRMT